MTKALIIVESPTKAKTITKILGSEFAVIASLGHIIDLPIDRLGVDIKHGFKPQYQVIAGKKKTIQALKEAVKDSSRIYLATDPDREGEAIAHHIANVIRKEGKSINRILFHEITGNAVKKALQNPEEIDLKKVDAQVARRVLDRLVGYMVSPLLWKTVTKGLSAGRVQSVALRMICEREGEIKAFVPQEYWTIDADLSTPAGENFLARVVSYIDKKIKIPNAEEKDRHLQRLNNREYYLKERSVKKVKRVPKPPFTTSTLQQEAGKRLHLPSAKTMRIAQSLYEGVEIGEKGPIGLITYMRTDSVRTAPEAIAKARSYIADAYGLKYLPDKPRLHTTKGRAQEAHEAIRPADTALEPKKIKKYLSKEQFELYQLIFTRFIASQMNDAVFEQTTLTISAEEYLLRATETVTVFRGFLQVWSEAEEENGDKESIASKLPKKYAVGDKLDLRQLLPEQHFTEPPLRYTESTLVKALDEKGIGRPSTYASIISVLFDRNYVERKERVLFPTELGETVNTILVNNFPDIFSEGFTANMEDQLDNIESGNLVWDKVVADFYHPFNSTLQDIQTRKTEIRKSLQESAGIKCEKCGSDMVIRWGKRGKFIACSNFPKCRNTKPLNGETQEKKPTVKSDKKCPECGADLFIRQGRYGPFLGCSNYPKCKYIENIELDVKCPRADCKGNIVKKRTKKGKFFFGCDKYPECDFVAWYQPVNKACPSCDNNYMEVHLSKSGEIWKCPKCKNEAKPF